MSDQPQEDFGNIVSKIVNVEITGDKMQAVLVVRAPDQDQAASLTHQDLSTIIHQAGVKYGVHQDVLQEVITEKKWGERVVVAEGTAAIPGEDAQLEFSFATEKSLKPKRLEDGQLDYKEVSVVHCVEKDAVLIKKIPAIKGSNGTDVLGNELPPKDGKDVVPVPGEGTYRDPEDSLLIRAKTEGVVFYNPKTVTVEVQQVYVVRESLGYSTGNLHVTSSVEIRDDVKPGLTVETPYNIQVGGVVEHATISCGGTLVVRAGIAGDDKGLIQVGGDVHCGYIHNQVLKSDGSVYVSSEIRDAHIECQDEVMVTSIRGEISGGLITATNKVSAATIGNVSYAPTVIEVGVNSKLKEEWLTKKTAIAELESHIEDMRQKVTTTMQHASMGSEDSRLGAIKREWEINSEEMERLTKEITELETEYYSAPEPVVCVSGTVYPNTLIKIRHAVYHINEELSQVVFRLEDGEISYANPSAQSRKSTDDTGTTETTESTQSRESTDDMGTTETTESTQRRESTEDTGATETTESTQGRESTEDTGSTETTESTKDNESTEKVG